MSKVPSSPFNLIQFLRQNTSFSRRKLLDHILNGEVQVNGQKTTDSMYIVQDNDLIKINHTVIRSTDFQYYIFHKPVGTISTFNDPKGRRDLQWHLKQHRLPKTLKPCGRLDLDSSGLLLFSNDGNFINHVLHPSFSVPKEYHIKLHSPLRNEHKQQLSSGLFLDDGPVSMVFLETISPSEHIVKISIGRNRIIRRAFDFLGYSVTKLHRLSIGNIHLNNLSPGDFQSLPTDVISRFKSMSDM